MFFKAIIFAKEEVNLFCKFNISININEKQTNHYGSNNLPGILRR